MFQDRLKSGRPFRRLSALAASLITLLCIFPGVARGGSGEEMAPYRHGGSVAEYFPEIEYDPAVPTPESVLGFALGARPVHHDEVIAYLQALADASPRAELRAFGRTHEARTMYYLIVGSEENVRDAERIRADIARIANPPVGGGVPDAARIISTSPVVAWMAYSIHGDELSGVDASLQTAYRLVAGIDAVSQTIRDNVLVLIDPNQNPDGRDRYLTQIFGYAGVVGNTDGQSLQHRGFWPYGRSNHYLFDMNRDWMPLVHPESRARVAAIVHWNPQLVVDAHEMGSQSSFLMSPPREPINLNVTPALRHWWDVFAIDHGAEFDRRRWSYYTGDWHEEWYPGYGSSWSLFTGAVGILYEQARVAGSGVRRYDGTTLSFGESIAHQVVSSMANLKTAADNREELLSDFARYRRAAVDGSERRLRGAYLLVPGENAGREHRFIETMLIQGLQVERATERFSMLVIAPEGTKTKRSFPAGTIIIPLNQPLGLLARAILEFDVHLSPEFLEEERRELEKGNGTRLYEVSGWSMSLAYNLDICYAPNRPGMGERLTEPPALPDGGVDEAEAGFGFLLPITDDRAMNALAAMLDAGLQVRSAEKPFVHNGLSYGPGTLLLRRAENPDDLQETLVRIARETGVRIRGVSSGYSSDGPDLGSDLFRLLQLPRVGLFIGSGVSTTSCGSLWYLLDKEIGMRQSLLDINELSGYNLSAYNVLILPSYWGGASGLRRKLGDVGVRALRDWISDGGTLIAVGQSAYFCADSASGLSAAREKSAVLGQLDEYDQSWRDEHAAFTATVDTNAVWRWTPPRDKGQKSAPRSQPELEEIKRRDSKARTFRPRGVIMRMDLNPEHWLTFGVDDPLNGLVNSSNALLGKGSVEVPVRLAEAQDLRLAGLLWPEARERWEKTAFVTRERQGRGQIILFADEPFFRAYFHGTKRLLLNAVLLGPGMGAGRTAPW